MVAEGLNPGLVVTEFELLVLEGFEAFGGGAFGGGGGGAVGLGLDALDLFVEFDLEFEDVVGADAAYGFRGVAVQVDQGTKGAFLAAAEEPVNGALLIGFDVVGDELVDEVAADAIEGRLARLEGEGIGDEVEVFGEGVGAKGDLDELDEAVDDVVIEVGLVGDGNDGVGISGELLVLAGVEGLPCVDEAGFVEGVAPHHAAHSVGDEGFDVALEVGAANGDLVVGDFGGEFVL